MATTTGGDLVMQLWDRVKKVEGTAEELRLGLLDFSNAVRNSFEQNFIRRSLNEWRQDEIESVLLSRIESLEERVGALEEGSRGPTASR